MAYNRQNNRITNYFAYSIVSLHRKVGSTSEGRRYSQVGDNAVYSPIPKLGDNDIAKRTVGNTTPWKLERGHPGPNSDSTKHTVVGDRPIDSSSSSSDEESDYLEQDRYLLPRFRISHNYSGLSTASSASTVRLHKWDFSFDAGGDDVETSGETSNQRG